VVWWYQHHYHPFKDKKKRRKAGYLLRMASERQKADQRNGEYKEIENYL